MHDFSLQYKCIRICFMDLEDVVDPRTWPISLQIICIISYFVLCINEYKLLAYYHDHIYYFLFVRHHIHPTLVKQIVVEWHIKLSGLNFTKRQHSTKYKVQTTYIMLKNTTYIVFLHIYSHDVHVHMYRNYVHVHIYTNDVNIRDIFCNMYLSFFFFLTKKCISVSDKNIVSWIKKMFVFGIIIKRCLISCIAPVRHLVFSRLFVS